MGYMPTLAAEQSGFKNPTDKWSGKVNLLADKTGAFHQHVVKRCILEWISGSVE